MWAQEECELCLRGALAVARVLRETSKRTAGSGGRLGEREWQAPRRWSLPASTRL